MSEFDFSKKLIDIELHEDAEERYYNDLKENPNNFSFWFPKVVNCRIAVPDSVIIDVPNDVMNALFMEKQGDKEIVQNFVETKIMPVIPTHWKKLFMKNGCFSNKFDFCNSCTPDNNVESIMKCLINLSYMSFMFDTCGNTEVVLREFIGADDSDFTQKIYNGMRLRPEIRVFYDFDKKQVLYSANYWDWDYCYNRICDNLDDKKTYEDVYPEIEKFFDNHYKDVEELISGTMKDVQGLSGIWSIDLMFAENTWWLIDMAIGRQSAYYDEKKIVL